MKKRVEIIKEGHEYPWGYIEPGALTFPEEKVAVTSAGYSPVFGYASDFQRGKDGEITADLDVPDDSLLADIFNCEDEDKDLISFSPFIKGIRVSSVGDEPQRVEEGEIKALVIMSNAANPGVTL